MGTTVVHLFPYSARMPGGHSNAIREFIDCQRAAGIDSFGLSPTTDEIFSNAVEPGLHCGEIPFENPTQVFAEISNRCTSKGDILHLHAISPLTTSIARLARSYGIKVVLTSHGQLNASGFLHFAKKTIYLALHPSPVRHAHGIHVLTQCEKHRLRFMLPWFRGKVTVIPHVVAIPARFAAFKPRSRDDDGERVILYLGRLDVRTKGLDLLLQAFAQARLPKVRLILAGPDWNHGKQDLESLAKRLGCRDQIEFPGAVYGENKERMLASADLFVATSRWDAFNLSVVEALARGIPTLISKRLNLAPQLEAAEAAIIVDCEPSKITAAIEAALGSPTKRTKTGLAGRAWVESNTSPAAVSAKFAAFYNLLK
ncbi:MAG: glycosyltransferase family 4 protein [Verrucomicrobiota bacterium]